MIKSILLQCKFLLVEFLDISYQVVPNPIRNYYLRLFGIRTGGVRLFTGDVNSFMWVN